MKILLEGKTQEEVEMMFSKTSLLETIAVEADLFINEMSEEHFTLLQDIIQSISAESTFTKNTDLTCEDIQNSMYLLA